MSMKHKKRGPANPLIPGKHEYCYVDGKKKRRYKSELDAELSAPTNDMQQYICQYCGFWHNGSTRKVKD